MADRRLSSQELPTRRRILTHFKDRDPKIARVIQTVGPFQLKRNRNYFVVLCRSIVSQQISTAAADTIYSRFQKLFDGHAPTPERVAGLNDAPLRAAGLSRQKAAYMKDLSRHFLDGIIRPRQLNYLDNEEIMVDLIRGKYGSKNVVTHAREFASNQTVPVYLAWGSRHFRARDGILFRPSRPLFDKYFKGKKLIFSTRTPSGTRLATYKEIGWDPKSGNKKK